MAINFLNTVQTTGSLGVGMAPSYKLDVAGVIRSYASSPQVRIQNSGNTGQGYLVFGDSDDDDIGYIVYDHDTNDMNFRTNAANRLKIDSIGNVGIGLSSAPAVRLEVGTASADIAIFGSSNSTTSSIYIKNSRGTALNTANIKLAPGSNITSGIISAIAQTDFVTPNLRATDLSFQTMNTGSIDERLRIDSTGSIKLNAYGGSGFTGTAAFNLEVDSSGNIIQTQAGGGGAGTITGSGTATQVAFFVNNNAGGVSTELSGDNDLYWDNTNDRLGIGANTPDYPLDVVGNIRTQTHLLVGGDATSDGRIYVRLADDTTKIFISSNSDSYFNGGKVGIGTTSPANLLTLNESTNNTTLAFYNDGTNASNRNWTIGSNDQVFGDFSIITSVARGGNPTSNTTGVRRLYINPSGNVGIGTTSPDLKLDVESADTTVFSGTGYRTALFQSTSAVNTDKPGITLGYDTTGGGIIAPATQSGTTNFLGFWTYNSGWGERMRLDIAGNLGIGVTPNASYSKLQVKSPASSYGFDLIGRDAGANSESQITFWNAAQTSTLAAIFNIADEMVFATGTTERMRIDSSGNVGIGTTLPDNKLQVDGAVHITSSLSNPTTNISGLILDYSGGNSRFFARGTAVNTKGTFQFFSISSTNSGQTTQATIKTDGQLQLNQYGGSGLTGTAAFNLSVDSSGNVIQTANPSGGTGTVTGSGTATRLAFWVNNNAGGVSTELSSDSNLYWDNTNDRLGIGTTAPTRLLQLTDGEPILRFNPTTVAGDYRFHAGDGKFYIVPENTGVPTMAFSSGKVGIGTTTPSAKLQVNGTVDNQIAAYFYNYSTVAGQSKGLVVEAGSNSSDYSASFNNKTGSSLLYVRGDGNVGIGVTAPVEKLQVEGKIYVQGNGLNWNEATPGTTRGSIHFDPGVSTDNTGNAITFGASDASSGTNAQSGIYTRSDGTYGTKMYFATTDSYSSGSKTAMMINYNGNVGIGTTAPTEKLEVAGNVIVVGNSITRSKTRGIGTNYATPEGWVESSAVSSATGFFGGNFNAIGGSSENKIEYDNGPFGSRELVWMSIPETGNNDDGGWDKSMDGFGNSSNNGFMSVIYVRRDSGTPSGNFYHGCSGSATENLNQSANTNPYFNAVAVSTLPTDVWCVAIGIIYANNDSSTVVSTLGGIYRLDTGQKIIAATTYRQKASNATQFQRVYHYYSTSPTAQLDFARPGFYIVDGSEPSLSELLNGGATDDAFWSASGNNIYNDNSSNVGIANTNPTRPLHVVGGDGGTGTHIAQFEGRAGVVGMYIRGDGNVGIGNTNPSRPLDVTADTGGVALKLRARSGNDYSFMSFTQNDGSGTAWAELAGIGTSGGLRIDTAGAERMRIDNAGTVKVINSLVPTIQLYNTDTSLGADQTLGDIDFYQSDPSGGGVGVVSKIRSVNSSSFQGEAGLAFHTGTATGLAERMRITSEGNVGIGTTASSDRLTVDGDIRLLSGNKLILNRANNGTRSEINTDTTGKIILNSINSEGIAVQNAGSTALTVTGTGNVGINKTNPGAKLHIDGGASFPQVRINNEANAGESGIRFRSFLGSNDIHGDIYVDASTGTEVGRMGFRIPYNGTEKMTILSSGNVGIGTTSPSATLELNSNTGNAAKLKIGRQNTATNYLELGTSGGSSVINAIGIAGVNADLIFNRSTTTTTSESMRIDSSGNVGIGTTSPSSYYSAKLVVSVPDEDGITIVSSVGNTGYLMFADGTSGSQAYEGYIGYDHNINQMQFRANNNINFNTNSGSRMRIDSSGNVGINTTAPEAKLQVSGGVLLGSTYTQPGGSTWTTANSQLILGGAHNAEFNTGTKIKLLISGYDNDGTSTIYPIYLQDENGLDDFWIKNRQAQAGIPTMYFAGNVGIGVTAPSAELHIASTGSPEVKIQDSDGTNQFLRVGHNGGNSFYISNDTTNDGGHIFSGSNGANVPTEKMRITSTGNVGIGTTSPGGKLSVSGIGTSVAPTVSLTNTSADNFNHNINAFAPNLTTGKSNILVFGKAGSTKNSAYVGYRYSGTSGSNDNLLILGHWASDNLMTISGDGNVGIGTGTTTPASKLQVAGSILISTSSGTPASGTNGLVINHAATIGGGANSRFYSRGDATDRGGFQFNQLKNDNTGSRAVLTIDKDAKVTVAGALVSANLTIADAIYHEGDTNNYKQFGTDTQIFVTAGVEKMRITSGLSNAGFVGIGTTSPGAVNGTAFGGVLLHTKGSGNIGRLVLEGVVQGTMLLNASGSTANKRLKFMQAKSVNGSSGGDAEFRMGKVTDSGSETTQVSIPDNGDMVIETAGQGLVLTSANGTQFRITVSNSGQLGQTQI